MHLIFVVVGSHQPCRFYVSPESLTALVPQLGVLMRRWFLSQQRSSRGDEDFVDLLVADVVRASLVSWWLCEGSKLARAGQTFSRSGVIIDKLPRPKLPDKHRVVARWPPTRRLNRSAPTLRVMCLSFMAPTSRLPRWLGHWPVSKAYIYTLRLVRDPALVRELSSRYRAGNCCFEFGARFFTIIVPPFFILVV